ncbi:acyltransferase [Paenibacillus athensensis]|uniref:CN hydrolase domain-containing protein n=1 Tax=Paenibacillus athensensis TaxID=1967502 RepID=A0A4Y8QAX2_9BACL|nr:nitrilase-related carbon-nitrogen hydrolase [Paenibacillus athensensis]MCD1260139.1 acyltransferase [Paenibacillus athensensis]
MKPITIAAAQYGLGRLRSEADFWAGLRSRIRYAAERGVQLLLLPEYMTAHLLSLQPVMTHEEACRYLDGLTEQYVAFFRQISRETGLGILGGTHICRGSSGGFVNEAFLFSPDGRVDRQSKLHLTPEEATRWPLTAGEELHVFATAWGPLSILTCYDMEFPELARAAALRGAELLLCPSYTDSAFGYHRVRYCCQARAVENQLFVALSGMTGQLPQERPQVDRGYCQAAIFAPCDAPFNEAGVLAAGEPQRDMLVEADIDYTALRFNRMYGAVAPLYNRRPQLYEQQSRHILIKES